MAVVRFKFTSPTSGNTAPVVGALWFEPTARRVIVGDPDNIVLPIPFSASLVDGALDVDLAETSAGWAWKITERIHGRPATSYHVSVPSGAGPIDAPELVKVNPGTLVPVEVNDPAFTVEATTLAAGASATAAITGSYPALKLNIGIPQGPAGAGAPPATSSAFGSIKIAGDIGGPADAPTVPGLTAKQDKSALDADMAAKIGDVASASRAALNTAYSRRRSVDIRDHGASTASADNSAAIQAAVTAAGTGVVEIPDGYWKIATTIDLSSGATVRLSANATVSITTDVPAFSQQGTIGTSTAITSGATAGSRTLVVASTTGLTVGGWVFISSDDAVPVAGKRGVLRRITNVAGMSVEVDTPLWVSMPTSPAMLPVALAPGLRISGGTVRQEDVAAGKSSLIASTLAVNPSVEGTMVGPGGGPGFTVSHVVGGYSAANYIDLTNDTATGHYGYAVNCTGASRGFRVTGGSATRVRHGFTTNTGAGPGVTNLAGEPENSVVEAAYSVRDCRDAGLDTHEQGYGTIFFPNVQGCAIGVQTRSTRTVIGAGLISGATLYGVHIAAASSGAIVSGATILNTGGDAGAAAVRSRTGVILDAVNVFDSSAGVPDVNADVDYEVRGGILAGAATGAGAQKAGILGKNALTRTGTEEIKQRLVDLGLLAAGTADLNIGGGSLTSTNAVAGRNLRTNPTGTTDIANRTDAPSGFTGTFEQYRINGVEYRGLTAVREYIRNTTGAPTDNPSSGGYLYAEGGALKWRGSSGTVTTIAPA